MRGAPTQVTVQEYPAGIIPAYAGSTLLASHSADVRGDHPRVCGEHLTIWGSLTCT